MKNIIKRITGTEVVDLDCFIDASTFWSLVINFALLIAFSIYCVWHGLGDFEEKVLFTLAILTGSTFILRVIYITQD
jgi:hypothetical protein